MFTNDTLERGISPLDVVMLGLRSDITGDIINPLKAQWSNQYNHDSLVKRTRMRIISARHVTSRYTTDVTWYFN